MQFFASLVLDRVWITLKMVDVLVQPVIFFLKLLHLHLEQVCLFALVCEGSETVMSEDDAIGHHERQDGSREGGSTATPQIDAVLRSPGELGQFGGELRLGWRASQVQVSTGS